MSVCSVWRSSRTKCRRWERAVVAEGAGITTICIVCSNGKLQVKQRAICVTKILVLMMEASHLLRMKLRCHQEVVISGTPCPEAFRETVILVYKLFFLLLACYHSFVAFRAAFIVSRPSSISRLKLAALCFLLSTCCLRSRIRISRPCAGR